MNKTIKIMSTIMIVMILCFTCTSVFAGNPSAGSTGGSSTNYIPGMTPPENVATNITTIGGSIAGIIQVAGMSIAVIILVYIGIRYILGSAEDQANYKKSMIPYIVGAVILFAASWLVGIIADFGTNLTQS